MELLYIWVDGFRNFKNIGFNLSDSYEIEYQRNSKHLKLDEIEKKHNIFGEKILNVTGVIGKNSTGKSNLLELIANIIKSKKSTFYFNFVAVFRSNNTPDIQLRVDSNLRSASRIYVYSNFNSSIISETPFNLINDSEDLSNLNVAYFSNIQDDRELNIPSSVINLTPSKSVTKRKSDILNQFKFLLSENYHNLDLEIPRSIIISTTIKPSYVKKNKAEINYIDSEILDVINKKFKNALKTSNPINHFTYSYTYSLFSYILSEAVIEIRNISNELFEINTGFTSLKDIFTSVFENYNNLNIKDLVEAIDKFIQLIFFEFTEINGLTKNDAFSLLHFIKAIKDLNPRLVKEGKYNQSKAFYFIDFNHENKKILKDNLSIFNHKRILELSWGGISSGHKAFLNVFSQFHSVIKKVNNRKHLLICIDEGDLYMHPVWQQEFLSRILQYFDLIYDVEIQIILTSHSPFLVSDLPRCNLIYLDKNDEFMCEVIPYNKSPKETFGTNLLDLYTNSFFLNGGTISKFAYTKIKNAVTMLKSSELDEYKLEEVKHIVSILGDDVIRFKLEKMLENAKNRNQ
ncbi:AAA family ATPase [Flammeovirga sp. SJP92]|uniref:AAA family ATPase n=1 Tax=Flammeovirga sp. SJP92 TaxID=1775430 RepID=UPI000786AE8E|nr:AAA family ATPase [Flammeovirga sp. SJP92]KXX72492.1 hypothetical protein AVL50_00030 [Flammeovirga sp. SJP92]